MTEYVYTLRVVACIPKDPENVPEEVRHLLPPVTDLYVEDVCRNCGIAIMVGPRQSAMAQLDSDVLVACYTCGARHMAIMQTVVGADTEIHDLGGGFTREGNVIDV